MERAPDIGRRLEDAGDRVRDAASDGAQRGLEGLQPLLDFKLLTISGVTITVGGLVVAALVLLGAWLLSWVLRRLLTRYGERHATVNNASLYTIARVIHYLLLALAIFVALDMAGIPLSKFGLFAGAIGVGLGFGLQAIFSNFISGLILLFDRSLKVGDFVELASGARGEVKDIKIRATRISTNDNIDILVPNSEFINGHVVNWTHRDVSRRLRVPFGVAYGSDKEQVRAAALEAAASVPFTLAGNEARKPQVWLVAFGDNSLDFELVVWLTASATKRPAAVQAAYVWALHTALCAHGIEFPFPQRDLHVRSLFGREGGQARDLLRELAGADSESLARQRAQRPEGHAAALQTARHAGGNDAVAEVQRQIASDASAGSAVADQDDDEER